MIRRLLIANRGEIAVRIIRACQELGVATVAVYSDADAHALHTRLADRAVRIGPAPSAESYLNIAAILEAARQSGADAIHPGYGFLSQHPPFAEACAAAGVVFVGPSAKSIAAMGVKIGARQLMQRAGVPVVPGETPTDQSDTAIQQAIARAGLPVMVKASAGGGGKGMRTVVEATDVLDAIQAARREAVAAFGDGTLYVEKRIERPHHVEVQVFGDASGHVVHVFERECSVQRRHQKVVEESPSPSIDARLRDEMTAAAVRAAQAVSYRGAGTVEFLLDPAARSFYFLEMNTRLQVEHPVTELVAGVDLVGAQLAVASGEPLPWNGRTLTQRGHAIEARVYAEDPTRGFLPQAGRLLLYREPQMPGIRIDSGVAEGDIVPVHYDALIAKVIAHADTRDRAIARLMLALSNFAILGIRTNIAFLLRLLDHPRFRSGAADTEWLDRDGGTLGETPDADMPGHVRAAIDEHRRAPGGTAGVHGMENWNPWSGAAAHAPAPSASAPMNDRAGVTRIGDGAYQVGTGDGNERVYVATAGPVAWAFCRGLVYTEGTGPASPAQRRRAAGAAGGSAAETLTAPMPGTVVRILTTPGATVTKGETLVILEAMKMELPIRALDDGVVRTVKCREGELVQADAVLVELN